MENLHFDSTDLAETEEFLSRAYTTMRIGGRSEDARTRLERRWLGPVSMDTLSIGFEMQFNVRPLNKVLIGRVHSGRIESRFANVRDVFGPGDVTLIAPPDQPYAGQVCHATYDTTMFATDHLSRVAFPAAKGTEVRLTGHRPVSKDAAERLNGLISYLHASVMTDPDCLRSPLVASTAAMQLASVVLETFPNNAQDDIAASQHQGVKAAVLRRAIAFIDDSAHSDISIVDIARHVNMTPRGVQYMFRRELDCTPMEYARRIRLDRAHRELVAATADTSTVAQIATRWGFAHKGRFARSYRQSYGKSPHETLLS